MNDITSTRQITFAQRIAELQRQLEIPADYAGRHQLELCEECELSVSIGQDIFDRPQKLIPAAARAWFEMRDSARGDGVEILVVSAFRAVDYQAGIIRRKLDAGQRIEDILKVSAAPGYSEHHSGRALDLTCPGFEPLEEVFEHSPAYTWLRASADHFGFRMSFPRNNCHNIAYEPWHWYWYPDF